MGQGMRGTFDDREMEPARQSRDTELTLGTTTLLAIFFGLVLLCGLCFGVGYSMGRRGSAGPTAGLQPEANAQTTLQADGSHPKPSARTATPAPADTTAAAPGTDDAPIPPTGGQSAQSAGGGSAATTAQAQVRPALPPAATQAQPALPSSVIGAAGSLMVQVAAVSNQEDADVLSNALRKRGYPVNERRDAGDGMVHVRIGPFNTRDDANKWRMKLLNDGYNAIVQP